MSTTVIGLFVGLLFGLAIAIDGFSGFLLLLVFGAAGMIVAKVIDGEIDLSGILNSRGSGGSR